MKISAFKKENYRTFITKYLLAHPDEIFTTRNLEKICTDNNYSTSYNTLRSFIANHIKKIKDADGKMWYGCPEAIKKIEKILKGEK